MKKFNVAVVGIGMVGQEMLRVLRGRNFPVENIIVLATRDRTENIDGVDYTVKKICSEAFEGIDIAIFAGTEGASGASQVYGWDAVKGGTVVIDNGNDFRMDDRVPLVVPEVNGDALKDHQGFVSNPNCSTIQMVAALGPLHREFALKRIVVSTYQSVSGTGRGGVAELEEQMKNPEAKPDVYPCPILGNLIPQISSLKDEFPGYYNEEIKMIKETRKILNVPELAVSATCVRVPVLKGHAEAVNVEFEKPVSVDQAREVLAGAEGIEVMDDAANGVYPTPLMAAGKDPVYVGRLRQDSSVANGLDMWVVADNIRKGAALNAVQIAEKMVELDLIK